MCRSRLKFVSPLSFISLLIALIDTCTRKKLNISLNCLVEVDCYLKPLFHLLYDKSVMSAEELLYFSLILQIVV